MNSSNPPEPRAPKRRAPIRIEAIAPFAIITAATIAYFTLFFDLHLRKGIEWAATRVNGGEVNIASLRTSFLKGSLRIENIEVTDISAPEKNRVQIGNILFQFSWDALLRAKFVIENAGLNAIQVNTPRKKPGYVIPPEEGGTVPSLFSSLKDKAAREARERLTQLYEGSALADAAAFLEGMDPAKALKDIGTQFKTTARIEQLSSELAKKEAQWSSALNTLPGEQDLAGIKARLDAIQVGGGKNPAEIAQQVSQVSSILSEANEKIGSVKSKADALAGDVGSFSKSVQELEELVKQDRMDLESRLKLPKLNTEHLAGQLFGGTVLNQVGKAQDYVSLARRYMPAKESSKGEGTPKPLAHPRAHGRTYEFGRPNSYPLFWLKKAEISSEADHSPFGGAVQGSIRDVASNPSQIGRPAVVQIQGDFPKQNIRNAKLKATLDHTTEIPSDSLTASVGGFPVSDKLLSDTDALKFGFSKATGQAGIEALVRGDEISLTLRGAMREILYRIAAQSKLLESTLQGVTREIPVVTFTARISGRWNDMKLAIESNLASALQRGLEKELQAKLAEARKKVDQILDEKVGSKKQELQAKYDGIRSQLTSRVEEKKGQADAVRAQATAKLEAVKNQASAALKSPAVENLKKKVKLPF